MPRLFIALDPPEEVTRSLASLQDDNLEARWVDPATIHLTLRFLGDIDPSRTRDVSDALEGIEAPEFELSPEGLGVFPSRRSPSVLWVGFEKNDALLDLQQKVEATVVDTGFDPEERSYTPHLTIARCRNAPAGAVHRFMKAHSEFSAPSFVCREFHLYESTLHPDGARHTKRASFGLLPAS